MSDIEGSCNFQDTGQECAISMTLKVRPGVWDTKSETMSVGHETRSVGHETRSVGHETRSVRHETRSVGHETRSVGFCEMPETGRW